MAERWMGGRGGSEEEILLQGNVAEVTAPMEADGFHCRHTKPASTAPSKYQLQLPVWLSITASSAPAQRQLSAHLSRC